MVGMCLQRLLVAPQQRVGGQYKVVPGNRLEQRFTCRPVQGQHAQARGEACRFALPVVQQRSGHHQQRRTVQATGFLLDQHMRQRLHGFAQAHVIGQHAPQALLAQVLQPRQAFALIGTQRCHQPCRRRHFAQCGCLHQPLHQCLGVLVPAELQARRVLQRLQAATVKHRQAQRRATLGEQIRQQGHDRFQSCGPQCQARVVARRQQDVLIIADGVQLATHPAGIGLQHLLQQRNHRHVAAFHLDVQAQVEPARIRRVRLDVQVDLIHPGDAMAEIVVGLYLPAQGFQARYVVQQEPCPVMGAQLELRSCALQWRPRRRVAMQSHRAQLGLAP